VSVVRPNGTPVSGAQATLTVSVAGCPADAFALPTTSAAGLIEVGTPTGTTVSGTPMTYSITATAGGQFSTATLASDPTGITNQTTGITYPHPSPVPFVLNVP
jgi:hypothetical protein